MELISILQNTPVVNSEQHGFMVEFGDLFNKCKMHGQDNSHIISAKLRELEKLGKIILIYQDGDKDLIIGIKSINLMADA